MRVVERQVQVQQPLSDPAQTLQCNAAVRLGYPLGERAKQDGQTWSSGGRAFAVKRLSLRPSDCRQVRLARLRLKHRPATNSTSTSTSRW